MSERGQESDEAIVGGFANLLKKSKWGKPAAERRAREKPLLKEDDGRRRRATGRTQQFNTRVKPEWREEIERLADERNISMAEFLERVLVEWKKLGGKAQS